MPATLAQSRTTSPGSGTTFSLAFSGAVSAGSTIGFCIRVGTSASGFTAGDSVNGANTWTCEAPFNNLAGDTLACGWFQNTGAGTPNVTVNWTGSASIRAIIWEAAGVVTAGGRDQFSIADPGSGSPTTTPSTPTANTTSTNEIILAMVEASNAGFSYTENASGSNPSSGWAQVADVDTGKLHLSYVVVSATGAYKEVWSTSSDFFSAGILSFAAAPSGFFSRYYYDMNTTRLNV